MPSLAVFERQKIMYSSSVGIEGISIYRCTYIACADDVHMTRLAWWQVLLSLCLQSDQSLPPRTYSDSSCSSWGSSSSSFVLYFKLQWGSSSSFVSIRGQRRMCRVNSISTRDSVVTWVIAAARAWMLATRPCTARASPWSLAIDRTARLPRSTLQFSPQDAVLFTIRKKNHFYNISCLFLPADKIYCVDIYFVTARL